MDLSTLVTEGERIDIDVDGASLKTTIQTLETADTFTVLQLTRKSIPVFIELGRVLPIMLTRADGIFIFDAKLMGYHEQDGRKFMRLQSISEPSRQQRRNSYRLSLNMDVAVKLLGNTPLKPEQSGDFTSRIYDLSEGGIGLFTNQSFTIGTMFDATLAMSHEHERIVMRCIVMRCIWPNKKDEPFKIGAQFIDISDMTRRKISKYILSEQVKQRHLML